MALPAPQNEIKIGDIRIVYLPDGEAHVDGTAMFPTSSAEGWELHREFMDDQGLVVASIGGFLIQTGGRNIVVDTGFGDKHVDFPGFGPFIGGKFLQSVKSAGVELEDIDTVLYTHLHLDHTGWTSRTGQNGDRALTFPNATHLTMTNEWDFWHGDTSGLGPDLVEVRQPLENHMEFMSDGQVVAPGVNVIATPGHTPGHVSLVISSGGKRVIILGDTMHCPVQFDEADWHVVFDVDPELGKKSRERVWRELEDPTTLGADGHFSNIVFGRLLPAQGKRQWRGGMS